MLLLAYSCTESCIYFKDLFFPSLSSCFILSHTRTQITHSAGGVSLVSPKQTKQSNSLKCSSRTPNLPQTIPSPPLPVQEHGCIPAHFTAQMLRYRQHIWTQTWFIIDDPGGRPSVHSGGRSHFSEGDPARGRVRLPVQQAQLKLDIQK